MEKIKAVSGSLKSTEEKTTEYSTTKDEITRSVRVREVENGFIVEVTEDGYKKTKNGKDWYHARKTYVSKNDPLDDNDETTEPLSELIKKAVDNVKL